MSNYSLPTVPSSLKVKLRLSTTEQLKASKTRQIIESKKLNTVCQEAACPNLAHCWSEGTATFMILGKQCTRRCGFCNIKTGRPSPLDPQEPENLAQAVFEMKLRHIVITSVDRDDLKDCGSTHFAQVIKRVREKNPLTRIEVLIPDFKARIENLERIWQAGPEIINHNIETVPSLYRSICPQSNYKNSLHVLELSKQAKFITKSGLILGLGESFEECQELINDLANSGVSILTIGQYLRPSSKHSPLKAYIPLKQFAALKEYAIDKGIGYVESGPLVRSSYHAKESFENYYNQIKIN